MISSMRSITPRIVIHNKKQNNFKKGVKVRAMKRLCDFDTIPDNKSVYILVFDYGLDGDGLYSLQEKTDDDVSKNIILAFFSRIDATNYGTLLYATMGRTPMVEMTSIDDLRIVCRECGYACKVAKQGAQLIPPKKTVDVTDWERANALRKERWSVKLDNIDAAREMLSRLYNSDE